MGVQVREWGWEARRPAGGMNMCGVRMNHIQSCLLSRGDTAPTYFPAGGRAMGLGGGAQN